MNDEVQFVYPSISIFKVKDGLPSLRAINTAFWGGFGDWDERIHRVSEISALGVAFAAACLYYDNVTIATGSDMHDHSYCSLTKITMNMIVMLL